MREFWIFIAHSVSDFPRKGLPPSAGASFVVFTLRLWLDFIEFVRTHKEIDMKNAVIFDLDGTLAFTLDSMATVGCNGESHRGLKSRTFEAQ